MAQFAIKMVKSSQIESPTYFNYVYIKWKFSNVKNLLGEDSVEEVSRVR